MPKKQAKKAARKAKKAAKQSKEQLVIAVLSRARELIAKGWTRGNAAKDEHGEAVAPLSEQACTFCAYGAITRSTYDLIGKDSDDAEEEILVTLGFKPRMWDDLFTFNDKAKSKKPILTLFDKAIAKLEAQ